MNTNQNIVLFCSSSLIGISPHIPYLNTNLILTKKLFILISERVSMLCDCFYFFLYIWWPLKLDPVSVVQSSLTLRCVYTIKSLRE